MTINKFDIPVIDMDSHWAEPPETWIDHCPAKYKDRVPKLVYNEELGRDDWLIENGSEWFGAYSFSVIRKNREKAYGLHTLPKFEDAHPSSSYPKPRLKVLDEMGIQAQMLFPNVTSFGGTEIVRNVKDPELRDVILHTYNDAMAAFQAEGEGRLYPYGIVPFWDVELAVSEVKRMKDLGFIGVSMSDSPHEFGFPALHDPYWEPILVTLQELGMPVHFHVGSGSGGARCYSAPWPGLTETQFMTIMPAELFLTNAAVIGNFIISGLLEKYPKLRVVSAESGIGFLPFYLEALDHQYKETGLYKMTDIIKMPPSEYYKRQVYSSFWFERFGVEHAIPYLGDDKVMFETDFPHPSCLYENVVEKAQDALSILGRETAEKVLYKNALNLYGLTLSDIGWEA